MHIGQMAKKLVGEGVCGLIFGHYCTSRFAWMEGACGRISAGVGGEVFNSNSSLVGGSAPGEATPAEPLL